MSILGSGVAFTPRPSCRSCDLSSDQGKTVNDYQAVADVTSPAGTYGIYYGDIVIFSLDGTVTSIYDGQQGGTFPLATNSGQTNVSAVEQRSESAADAERPGNVTAYYHGDHLGSTRVVTAAGGWPIASDDFLPFGQELTPPADPNHYKFTGKERDSESGLDYFGARYYASSIGRWMSPDYNNTGDDPEPIPYADLEGPQSLNLYSYVGNNPLYRRDPDGHSYVVYDGSANTLTLYSGTGERLGVYPANNNVDSGSSLGRLPDGTYPVLDQNSPYTHGNAVDPHDSNLQDSEDGEFGPGGIFRIQAFKGPDGKIHRGVGVHAGRKNKRDRAGRMGPAHATQGCIRTCDAAIHQITNTVKTDPLTSLEVIFNRPADNSSVTTSQQDSKDGVPIKPCGGGNPCNQ